MMLAIGTLFAKDETRVSKHTTVSVGNISITYGQPSKKGREIFGGLVPYGQVWRTGADEATEITFTKPCLFGGKQLEAGTYTLFTIPGKTEWTIILNKQLKQWGWFGYDKVKDQDRMKVTVPSKQTDDVVETFTITPRADGFLMEWDKTSVFVPAKAFYWSFLVNG